MGFSANTGSLSGSDGDGDTDPSDTGHRDLVSPDDGPEAALKLPAYAADALPGGAPADYGELLAMVSKRVLRMADNMRIPRADQEDALSEVMLRFWRKGSLEMYDPKRLFQEPDGGWRDAKTGKRPARFATYFRQFMFLTLLGIRDQHRSRIKRQILTDAIDDVVEAPDDLAHVESSEMVRSFRAKAREEFSDEPVLVELVDAIASLSLSGREVSRPAIAAELGWSVSKVFWWMRRLREREDVLRGFLAA